jgi:hypothetical protein
MADQGKPMRALGEPVATSSIKTALGANASGPTQRLVRMAPGWYVLA